jgi:enoyl-CoA hydratase/carnithine racemase
MGPKLVDYLLYEKEDNGILWIKFNRPDRLNALVGNSQENGTVAKVGEYMRAGDDDPDVRVIVLTGVGRAFCAGADLKGREPESVTGLEFVGARGSHDGIDASRQHFFHGFTKLHRDISLIRKPTIAMINGPAVGSGMDMALHCDIRIGCEATRFVGYQNAGQIIENGGSYYLPKMVGLGRALEFAYTGHLDAERAMPGAC